MQYRTFIVSLNVFAETAWLPEVTEGKTAFNQTSDNDFESAYFFLPSGTLQNISIHCIRNVAASKQV